MQIFVAGYPGDVGGANTECWHTVKLWRRLGLDVTLIPTWDQAPTDWCRRLELIGCATVVATPGTVAEIPRLSGSIVVSFCNTKFLAEAHRFQAIGCRIVWSGCMNWMFPAERLHYRRHGVLDRYVFQSRYQRDQLQPQLRKFGYQDHQGCVIRGAFCREEFPFRPRGHEPGEQFVVGRLSRCGSDDAPAHDKYPRDLWWQYGRIPHPLEARVMGWNRGIQEICGSPPAWAVTLPQCSQTPQAFFSRCHALVPGCDCCAENWPRVGLEAMAAGVPVVAENKGGWPEMIRHGSTGYLAHHADEMAYCVARLAYDEQHRRQMAYQARRALEEELANPEVIGPLWLTLFEQLQ